MFSKDQPIKVALKSIYKLRRSSAECALEANVYHGTPHSFRFALRGQEGCMTVDDIEESRSTFYFSEKTKGCFSLASNGSAGEAGAFRFVRLTVGGETVLDIDFAKIRSVDALEDYFDCYYFPDINCNAEGDPVSIHQYWALNERGHLVCANSQVGRVAFGDKGPFCLLTLKHGPVDDFDVEIGFEQSWRRYGIVFGCDRQAFPYYQLVNSWKSFGIRGALVFADSHNGACFARGAMLDPVKKTPVSRASFSCPQVEERFLSAEGVSLSWHTLTYHFDDTMTYHTETGILRPTSGAVVYLPPHTPCRLEGEPDRICRIEFESDRIGLPMCIVPKQPEMVQRMFEEINNVWAGGLSDRNYRAMSVFYRLMAALSQPTLEKETADMVRTTLRYIHYHFTDPALTVKEVATGVGISESSFYRLFQSACGMTPKAYILNCRLQHACSMLETQDYELREVAEKSGFSDVKYFMTAFKREMGISPGKYQKQGAY